MSSKPLKNGNQLRPQTKKACSQVTRRRKAGSTRQLAQALEDMASELIKEVDLINAAVALEEAAQIWQQLSENQRLGNCLILATSSRRLANDLEGAKNNLQLAQSLDLPGKIQNAFWLECCEQLIAVDELDRAFAELTDLLSALAEQLESDQKAKILQRRAAVAIEIENWRVATGDFLEASRILTQQKLYPDADACALAAATAATDYDTEIAEQIVSEVLATVPRDGSAAVARGLVGGRVALTANNPELALQRFDAARQGAVDACDPISYLSAVIYACETAEMTGDFISVYSRYARAWASLTDLLDTDSALKMVKPELEKFRDRIGADKFNQVKTEYEIERREQMKNSGVRASYNNGEMPTKTSGR